MAKAKFITARELEFIRVGHKHGKKQKHIAAAINRSRPSVSVQIKKIEADNAPYQTVAPWFEDAICAAIDAAGAKL